MQHRMAREVCARGVEKSELVEDFRFNGACLIMCTRALHDVLIIMPALCHDSTQAASLPMLMILPLSPSHQPLLLDH